MEQVFDIHLHYTFDLSVKDMVEIFKKEFDELNTYKYAFLSIPHESLDGKTLNKRKLQNEKGLFFKKTFSPNGYAFAGLIHPDDLIYDDSVSEDFLNQAKSFYELGYDGIKMLEGYPQFRKACKIKLDDGVYDKYYDFLEEKGVPIIMHLANPEENWDINKVSEYAKAHGRWCDETYPTKEELHIELENVLKKHPKLKLLIAHFGFMSTNIERAKAFLDNYPNTGIDITPGGEQFFNMLKKWDEWKEYFVKYQDRIYYGTDLYAFPVTTEAEWRECFMRRPRLVRQFFETSGNHEYLGEPFHGVDMDKSIRDKIYRENALKLLGEPRKINLPAFLDILNRQATRTDLTNAEKEDIIFMLKNL